MYTYFSLDIPKKPSLPSLPSFLDKKVHRRDKNNLNTN